MPGEVSIEVSKLELVASCRESYLYVLMHLLSASSLLTYLFTKQAGERLDTGAGHVSNERREV